MTEKEALQYMWKFAQRELEKANTDWNKGFYTGYGVAVMVAALHLGVDYQ